MPSRLFGAPGLLVWAPVAATLFLGAGARAQNAMPRVLLCGVLATLAGGALFYTLTRSEPSAPGQ